MNSQEVEMKYQLVFQFAVGTSEELNSLLALEEIVLCECQKDPSSELDGHDFGMREFNIFIHTSDPQAAFVTFGNLIRASRPDLPFAAGYRAFDEDGYTPLWPQASNRFSVA
jgi:hypothetical protein